MSSRKSPGQVRDAILKYLRKREGDADVTEIRKAVNAQIGPTSPSSVRSYLRLNTPKLFERTARGRYGLAAKK